MVVILASTSCSHDDIEPSTESSEVQAEQQHQAQGNTYTEDLLRSYGVGYGYEGTETYTDYNSVRDVVIDITKLQQYEKEKGVQVFSDNLKPTISMKVIKGYDSEQLAKALSGSAGVNLDVSVFTAEVKANYASNDLKRREYSFCTVYNKCTLVSRHCDPRFIRGIAETNPEVLSYGFRSIITRIKNATDNPTRQSLILELIKNYGTFFVYEADLGGRLSYASTYERKSLSSDEALSYTAKLDFCKIMGVEVSEGSKIDYEQTQTCHSYSLKAMGGDVRICSSILRDYSTESPSEAISQKDMVDQWYKSIKFDPSSKENTNVELIDFKLCPIYELIPDKEVREAVAERFGTYLQVAYDGLPRVQYKIYNAFNIGRVTDLPSRRFYQVYDPVTEDPIMEGGLEIVRYNGHRYRLSTVYPIIEGYPKNEGLAVCLEKDGTPLDSLYIIQWLPRNGNTTATLVLTPVRQSTDLGTIYYNDGTLGLKANADQEYTYIDESDPKQLNLSPTLFIYNQYVQVSDICRVGPWMIAILQRISTNKSDANYDQRILADIPQGWHTMSKDHPMLTGTTGGPDDMALTNVNIFYDAFRELMCKTHDSDYSYGFYTTQEHENSIPTFNLEGMLYRGTYNDDRYDNFKVQTDFTYLNSAYSFLFPVIYRGL